jgi:hypothetical protein
VPAVSGADALTAKLDGVFRNISFNSANKLGETKDRNRRLRNLLGDFKDLDLRPKRLAKGDIIGDAYTNEKKRLRSPKLYLLSALAEWCRRLE